VNATREPRFKRSNEKTAALPETKAALIISLKAERKTGENAFDETREGERELFGCEEPGIFPGCMLNSRQVRDKSDGSRDVGRKSSYQRDTASGGEGAARSAHSDDTVRLRIDVDRWPRGNGMQKPRATCRHSGRRIRRVEYEKERERERERERE